MSEMFSVSKISDVWYRYLGTLDTIDYYVIRFFSYIRPLNEFLRLYKSDQVTKTITADD